MSKGAFTGQPGDLSTLTDEHREFVIAIKELHDCSTLTAAYKLPLSLIQTNVFGDLEIITIDCSLASLVSGPTLFTFIAYCTRLLALLISLLFPSKRSWQGIFRPSAEGQLNIDYRFVPVTWQVIVPYLLQQYFKGGGHAKIIFLIFISIDSLDDVLYDVYVYFLK